MSSTIRLPLLLVTAALLTGCSSAYYGAMEKVGIHKRDIMVDRIEDARGAQQEGQEQFKNALEQFRSVVAFQGGDLEDQYNKLNTTYEDSAAAAAEISERIDAVESVAEALFDEWSDELKEYTSANLRRDSANKLKSTQRNYERLMSSMRRSEKSLQPVLNVLKDNVLYLKHNLNAAAINTLKGELRTVDANVKQLLANMEASIAESNRFIDQLNKNR